MISLSSDEKLYIENLLLGSFDSYEEYREVSNQFDTIRLLNNNGVLYILKAWDSYIDLAFLGHLSNTNIIFYDTLYRKIKEFSYNNSFGDLPEHIEWLNSRPNGEQVYLRIAGLDVKSILCLIVNRPPLSYKKQVIESWLSALSWDNASRTSEIILSYKGQHTLTVYYLNAKFTYNLSREDIINNPSTEIIEVTFRDNLIFYTFKEGFYLFKKVVDDVETWLRIDNSLGLLDNVYSYINSVNYLGEKQNIQISLNIENEQNVILPKYNNFLFNGTLIEDVVI